MPYYYFLEVLDFNNQVLFLLNISIILRFCINNFRKNKYNIKHIGVDIMANLENEVWKSIPGFENKYEVSNMGRVRSLTRTAFITNFKGTSFATPKKRIHP